MNGTQTHQEQRPDAVVWIDERHAIIAQRDPAGGISTIEVRRLQQAEPRYLGHVVHELGNHEHVMLIGAGPIRLALERRFVAVTHSPEHLLAPMAAGRINGAKLAQDISRLAA